MTAKRPGASLRGFYWPNLEHLSNKTNMVAMAPDQRNETGASGPTLMSAVSDK